MGTIVVGIDDSQDARRALRWALAEARKHGAKLVAVHAWTPATLGAAGAAGPELLLEFDAFRRAEERVVEQAVEDVLKEEAADGVEIERRTVEAAPAHALMDVATAEQADLLVVGRHGHGALAELLLGSVSSALIRHAPCPLALVPRPTKKN
jgi:nucleotide-binding universal stress UspA family protein